jgi:hypothetical protein
MKKYIILLGLSLVFGSCQEIMSWFDYEIIGEWKGHKSYYNKVQKTTSCYKETVLKFTNDKAFIHIGSVRTDTGCISIASDKGFWRDLGDNQYKIWRELDTITEQETELEIHFLNKNKMYILEELHVQKDYLGTVDTIQLKSVFVRQKVK